MKYLDLRHLRLASVNSVHNEKVCHLYSPGSGRTGKSRRLQVNKHLSRMG